MLPAKVQLLLARHQASTPPTAATSTQIDRLPTDMTGESAAGAAAWSAAVSALGLEAVAAGDATRGRG